MHSHTVTHVTCTCPTATVGRRQAGHKTPQTNRYVEHTRGQERGEHAAALRVKTCGEDVRGDLGALVDGGAAVGDDRGDKCAVHLHLLNKQRPVAVGQVPVVHEQRLNEKSRQDAERQVL